MESVLAWGMDVVRSVQGIASPVLTEIMKAITAAGSGYFYMALVPLVLWCVDARGGTRIGLLFSFSGFLNAWLKLAFALPRPYDIDPGVGMIRDVPYGIPSGHSQNSVLFWGMLAGMVRRRWTLALAVAIPLLIGFSRVYLGAHFPTDVLAGWGIGIVLVVAYLAFGPRLEELLADMNIRFKIGISAVIAFGMNWLNMKETGLPGLFFGAAAGAAFMFERVRFSASGSAVQKVLRYVIGLAVTAALYVGPKFLSPAAGQPNYELVHFVRYAALGAWVTLGAPWLFVRLGLAGTEEAAAEAAAETAPAAEEENSGTP